eukprot:CAMPEP_0194748480 /NCGR_PEP_ID=MMETSP0323_2-20130528/2604_1 /TAXON_ID=2866 ORGANISM="Crypthecodinium cohnii, Strain Seligo" /NCGR_SAMPLE_ID=MMETSP0323_2 /ASSEMBLY_ACC=CAM_ASM_000346 /LENGTH=41 /DNA_ID= /DNA_START= /DNA_END= /DNA_ORIENTATION=
MTAELGGMAESHAKAAPCAATSTRVKATSRNCASSGNASMC